MVRIHYTPPVWVLAGMSKLGSANRKRKVLQQLGMTDGVARYRLVRLILFDFVKRAEKDGCFKCGRKILTAEELSIEHKQPWCDVDAALYWDLENIAFSHSKCNRPHRYRGGSWRRAQYPEGKSWCCLCKSFKLEIEFYQNKKGRWNGLSWTCKPCQRTAVAKYKASKK